jgi:hypothetical protein
MTPYPRKICTVCGKTWQPETRYQSARNLTCSKACAGSLTSKANAGPKPDRRKRTTVTCPECGTEFEIRTCRLQRVKSPTCSRQCNGKARGRDWAKHAHKSRAAWTEDSLESFVAKMSGPNNPAWKGGVTYWRKAGNYPPIKYVRAPDWALPMARQDGYIMEHRLLRAAMVGRMLSRSEVVHHRDHDPLNNAPSTIELWPSNGSHKAAEHGRVVPGVTNRWRPRSWVGT